jgi:hypothetical protein
VTIMKFSHIALAAVLVLAMSRSTAGQSAALANGAAPAGAGVVAMVDVGRLPIDLGRMERQFRRTTIREERDGLNLRYFVDVYAKAPAIVLITPEDNVVYGPAPYGAPTHREMVQMMTPREFRASGMMLGSSIGVPRKKTDKR